MSLALELWKGSFESPYAVSAGRLHILDTNDLGLSGCVGLLQDGYVSEDGYVSDEVVRENLVGVLHAQDCPVTRSLGVSACQGYGVVSEVSVMSRIAATDQRIHQAVVNLLDGES
jgi:hypothetical protein